MQNLRKRMNLVRGVAMLVIIALTAVGCAGVTPTEARQMLWEPASCDNSQADIELLEGARPGGFKRFTQGLQAILPPSVILSLIRDIFGIPYRSIYLDHWRTAFGSYDTRIDERVVELKACG
jgi:hypothetical protein